MINAKKIEVRCPWMTNCKTKLPMNYKLRKCWNLLGITSSSTLRSRARSLRCTGLLNICRTCFELSASSSRQTKLAFKLDFSGKLCTCCSFRNSCDVFHHDLCTAETTHEPFLRRTHLKTDSWGSCFFLHQTIYAEFPFGRGNICQGEWL